MQKISIQDLLGREAVLPKNNLLKESVEKLVICIIGAGGSIASELTNNILKLNPKKIILYDNSELNLYNLSENLKKIATDVPYELVLADATDYTNLVNIF